MQCVYHPATAATNYCSNCGTALCSECVSDFDSRILCLKCLAEFKTGAQPAQQPFRPPDPPELPKRDPLVPPIPPQAKGYPYCSPGVSLGLGFIPGVGSICNGDYLKAFLQVLIFGSLASLSGSHEAGDLGPVFGVLTAAVYFYMPFEAYHIAKRRTLALQGITVITPLERIKFPELWVGSLAILVGSIFMVNQFVPGTLRFVLHGWPLILIGIGLYNLTRYFRTQSS
jgi:hypothetical protein